MTHTEAVKRVNELRALLERANRAYYDKADPIMSDREFDRLLEELANLEDEFNLHDANSPTQTVGGSAGTVLKFVDEISLQDSISSNKNDTNSSNKSGEVSDQPSTDFLDGAQTILPTPMLSLSNTYNADELRD